MPKRTTKDGKKPRPPRCRICRRAIRVPKGWSGPPAVRKHYWAKHREVMQPNLRGRR